MRKTCLNMIYQMAKQDSRVIFIGSDLGCGTLDEFKREMPERFLMEGVSEAHIMGMATGLALEGRIPYINTIATFITRRCFEQIVLDLCLHKVNVRLIGSGGGLVYAPLGPTHLAIEDMAIMRAIPHMTIIAPSDAEEMKRIMPMTLDYDGPIYIRLGKGNDPVIFNEGSFLEIGKASMKREGGDALLISTGITTRLALEAAENLSGKGLECSVLHFHTVKPFDTQALIQMTQRTPVVVTVEEHTIMGGLGSAVAECIAEAGFNPAKKFRRLALPDLFPEEYGSQASLMERYKITSDSIVSTVLQLKEI